MTRPLSQTSSTFERVGGGGGSSASSTAATLASAFAGIPRGFPSRRGAVVVTHFQTGHGATLLNGTGTYTANATDDFTLGTQSAKLVTAGTSTWSRVGKNGFTAVDGTGKALRVWLKTLNSANAGTITVYAGTGAGASFYAWDITQTAWNSASQYHLPDGVWSCFTLSFAHAAVTGTPTLTALTDFSFAVTDNGVAATVWCNGFDLFTESTKYPNGVVTLCFDDVFVGQWTNGKPLLDAAGYQATLFPIVDLVGSSGSYLTLANIKAMQDQYGWEIAPHAYTNANHTNFGSMTSAQIQADIVSSVGWMATNGLRYQGSYAYPLGYFSSGQMDIVSPYVSGARTIQNRHNSNTLPVAHHPRLWSVSGVGGSGGYAVTNLTNASGLLDQVKTAKSWVILTMHDVSTGASGSVNQISVADLTTLVAGIQSRSMAVATMGEVLANGGFIA